MWSACVLVVLTMRTASVLAEGEVCSDAGVASATFSVVSRRNQTGHWLAEVSLSRFSESRPAVEPRDIAAVQFDLSFSSSRCGGGEILRTTAYVTVPPPRPGPGYELRGGLGYYKFHPEGKTFEEAAAACRAEGAHLAIVNSERESDVIQELYERHPKIGDWAFVGFHDQVEEGRFVTIFGDPLETTGFTRWAPTQPDNGGPLNPPEHCGTVNRRSGLNDYVCGWKAPFVCEQEL